MSLAAILSVAMKHINNANGDVTNIFAENTSLIFRMTFSAKSMNIVFGSSYAFPRIQQSFRLRSTHFKSEIYRFYRRVNSSLILVVLSMLPRKKDNGLKFGNSKHGNTNLG